MASFRSFIVRQISGYYMRKSQMAMNPQAARRDFQARMTVLPAAKNVQIAGESIDGVDCEWLVPEGCEDAPVIYYLHGGA